MKYIIRLCLMVLAIAAGLLSNSIECSAQLRLLQAWPDLKDITMSLKWQGSVNADTFELRMKQGMSPWSEWMPMDTVTSTVISNLNSREVYSFQVREKIFGFWSDPSNIKSNGFLRVWPVRKASDGTTPVLDILHGFGQPYGGAPVGGTKIFHEGLDMQGESAVNNEPIMAPVGGLVRSKGGTGASIHVSIEVKLPEGTRFIEFNHMKGFTDELVVDETIGMGELMGWIGSHTWNTISSHTHCHFSDDYAKGVETSRNPFLIWEGNPTFTDPYGVRPQVIDVNGDGEAVRFKKGPHTEDFFPDKKPVHNAVDIEVEAVDRQSVDAPWQNPSQVGYFIQFWEQENWVDKVRTAETPYLLFNSRIFYDSWPQHPNTALIEDMVDFKNDVMSKSPNTPSDYFWQQWFTYKVTNSFSSDGDKKEVKMLQCWATDARDKEGGQANGYEDNYQLARAIDEAKFKDGKYQVGVHLADLAGKAPTYFKELRVDNFRPYVKGVDMKGGDFEYKTLWMWDKGAGQAELFEENNEKKACGSIRIKVMMSESMKEVKVAVPGLEFEQEKTAPVGGTDRKEWEFEIPADKTKDKPEGPYKLEISGHDMDDNEVQGFNGKGVKSENDFHKKELSGNWVPAGVPVGKDMIHEFRLLKLEIAVSTKPPSGCNKKDGTATINVSGDPGPFEYRVDGSPWQASNTFKNLEGGTHEAVVRKKDTECEFPKQFVIEDGGLKVRVSGYGSKQVCEDENPSITLTASAYDGSGDYSYSWPGGTLEVSGSGTYPVTVTDNKTGCTKTVSGKVTIIPIVCSRDPNDIVGPPGYGPGKMIAKSKSHQYMVRFENDPEFATAPAQIVKINHPLDPNANLLSVRLGSFGFANMNFTVPADKTYYTGRVDVMDSLGVVVDVTAGIDVRKKEIFWIFESKDPATGLPPADALLGFLPVNDATGKGEGYVTYTVKPANNSQTGDTIHAKASIVFDVNAAIETPAIWNTIDALPAVSKVKPLPATTANTRFRISWEGADDMGGSGIQDYVLYMSEQGGAFRPVQPASGDTELDFEGVKGHTYRFFTLATDHTGNVEAMKHTAEATIRVTDDCSTEVCDGVDNDCDGEIDEGCGIQRYYMDVDKDGFGRDNGSRLSATPVPGWVLKGGDCADWDATIYPGAPELANGRDDNCNGQIDEGLPMLRYYMDVDRDGYGRNENAKLSAVPLAGYVLVNGDCADFDATIYPGAPELANGRDDNCNAHVDEGLPTKRYYLDVDKDGYGRNEGSRVAAYQLQGYVLQNGDCADFDATIYPGAPELPNNRDDNCNAQIDEGLPKHWYYPDVDKDGYGREAGKRFLAAPVPGFVLLGGDCHDYDPKIYPGAPEIKNNRDDNCNGMVDELLITQHRVAEDGAAPAGLTKEPGSLQIIVSPVPSNHDFTVYLQRGLASEPVSIKVFDHVGRQVDSRQGLNIGARFKLGSSYASGYYTLEVVQGTDRKVMKLIKL